MRRDRLELADGTFSCRADCVCALHQEPGGGQEDEWAFQDGVFHENVILDELLLAASLETPLPADSQPWWKLCDEMSRPERGALAIYARQRPC